MHELCKADTSIGLVDRLPDRRTDFAAMRQAVFVRLWQAAGRVSSVLHVAYDVPNNGDVVDRKLADMSKTENRSLDGKRALITGAARRIGAATTERLHEAGVRVAIHYRSSDAGAKELCNRLNNVRPDSAEIFAADLNDTTGIANLVNAVTEWGGGLDILINNASSFYPTPIGSITEAQWDDLIGSNLKAPLFLSQAASPHLKCSQGVIINMLDIHSKRPLKDHAVYTSAKAGLAMLTLSLAKDLAPDVRVNGIAPGAILWPEEGMTEAIKEKILNQVPLERPGNPSDIADCVIYLARDAAYVTGQIIAVDGGRSIGW
jgi:pteridine reductase